MIREKGERVHMFVDGRKEGGRTLIQTESVYKDYYFSSVRFPDAWLKPGIWKSNFGNQIVYRRVHSENDAPLHSGRRG